MPTKDDAATEQRGAPPSCSALLSRPAVALLALVLLFAALCLPRIDASGLWDPQEVRLAEAAREVSRGSLLSISSRDPRPPLPLVTLALGIRLLGTTELAVRLPAALCGLLLLAALFFLGMVLYPHRPRAAGLAALLLLLSPTFYLGARQATLHLQPALGQTLTVLGLSALALPRDEARPFLRPVGALTALLGLSIGFLSAGAAPGCAVPLLAVAVALALSAGTRAQRTLALGLASLSSLSLLPALRVLLGRMQLAGGQRLLPGALLLVLFALLAALLLRRQRAALVLAPLAAIAGLAFLLPPAIEPSYSPFIGGYLRWPANREVQVESVLKPLMFRLFPFAAFVPVAIAAHIERAAAEPGARARFSLLVPLCWLAAAYLVDTYQGALVTEQPFAALSALCLVSGLCLDGLLAPRQGGASDAAAARLAGVCVALFCTVLGRDLYLFPEQLASAHYMETLRWPPLPSDPAHATVLSHVPLILALSGIGIGLCLGLGVGLAPQRRPRFLSLSLLLGLCLALFSIHGMVPALSRHLSYRGIYTKFQQLGGGTLATYAVPKSGSSFYTQESVELTSIQEVFEFLGKDKGRRAFVMVGARELAPLDHHARKHGRTYYVVDDSNLLFLLLSDRLGEGEKDLNPLRRQVLASAPAPARPLSANFEEKIELIGYDIPDEVRKGQDFIVRLYFKALAPLSADYRIFLHIEGGGTRINGDHTPLDGKFPTQYWTPGYYIVDEHRMTAARQHAGVYQVLVGFWPGGSGARLKVISGPSDGDNRVRLGSVRVK